MKKYLFATLALIFTFTFGQKLKISKGDVKQLKSISEYSVEFDYSNLEIPKYSSEEEFLKDKMAKREEKEPGAGERFRESWFSDREERYHPKFIESFNKRFKNGEKKVSDDSNAEYVMSIHTQKMYPGYNVGVVRHNAEITAEITIYKKSDPSKIIFQGTYTDVQGGGAAGYDFDSGYRISECYAKLAKEFAELILKKAK